MLNIEVNRSAEGVERYFDRELAMSDYLMKEPGIWAGRGAERLGLRGLVQRSEFVALLRKKNPTTHKRLTARMNTSRPACAELCDTTDCTKGGTESMTIGLGTLAIIGVILCVWFLGSLAFLVAFGPVAKV